MTVPVLEALPDVRHALEHGRSAVLVAPPGAGKTTGVPLALLDASWLGASRIIMLEPRRLAARAAASYMARLLGEPVGHTVGYRVRHESRVSRTTRLEVVTEGVLTRMLVDDPTLEGYGLVIFDEFHERSVHADLGLALSLQARALVRDDLRILVMSATLDAAPVADLLDGAPVIRTVGHSHPVETHYLDAPVRGHIEPVVARTVRGALRADEGDILVFLPGAAEIARVHEALADLPPHVRVHRLHGSLTQQEQDSALAPAPAGTRKVVLSSAIAETSLTIEGVRIVVDSGWMRVPRFAPRIGMMGLATVRITRDSADQRRGRAGRTAPGTCYRLWTAAEDGALLPHGTPEILETDLTPLALDLAAWGVADPTALRWLDPPPAGAFAQARTLLRSLDALDREGAITPHGRALARLPVHPRLAHMLTRAEEDGVTGLGCEVAALVEERDVLRGAGEAPDPDLGLRLAALHGRSPAGADVDRRALERVRRTARDLEARVTRRRATAPGAHERRDGDRRDHVTSEAEAGRLLALAYPDRVGRARGTRGGFILRTGRGARVPPHSALAAAPWIVAAAADGHDRDSRVLLGAALAELDVLALFGDQVESARVVELDERAHRVRARVVDRLGAIVLRDVPVQPVTDGDAEQAIVESVRARGPALLPWTDAVRGLRERLAFLHATDPAWPDVSDAALARSAADWLGPFIAGSAGRLDRIDLGEALLARVDWALRQRIDELAPTHLEVPSGSRVRIDYADALAPVLAARIQELFGWTDTPRLAGGRVPLTIHLLSPARRPVQVTRDLASFWRAGYFDVRRDLRGRYPKHFWPDDPLTAAARRGVRG